jgi:hypothetical protein
MVFNARLEISGDFDFLNICIYMLLVAAISLILKNFGFKGAPLICALSLICVAIPMLERLKDIEAPIGSLVYSEAEKYIKAAAKVVGIGYLSGICSDVCKEIGEGGVAKCITLVSKLELIAVSAPFIKEVFDFASSLCLE